MQVVQQFHDFARRRRNFLGGAAKSIKKCTSYLELTRDGSMSNHLISRQFEEGWGAHNPRLASTRSRDRSGTTTALLTSLHIGP